jgi:ComEC/Rec2-related protein
VPELPFELSRRRLLIVAGCLALLLFLGSKLLARPQSTAGLAPPVAPPAETTAAAAAVVVDVVGAVRRPGLYRLAQGGRIADAVARAGGATPKAELSLINLAAPLADGEQIVVPKRGATVAAGTGAAAPGTAAATGPVHLSTATLEQLDALPGIGPVTAQKILDYRQKHGAFHVRRRARRGPRDRPGAARPAQGPGRAVNAAGLRSPPHALLAALCLGIAFANVVRLPALAVLGGAGAIGLAATSSRRVAAIACGLALGGWWWGSARLNRLDQSALRPQVGRAERALVEVTAAPRRGRFDLKMPVRVLRFGPLRLDEPAQLELPLGRGPPRGGVLDIRAEAKLPRGPSHGFDERTWLRRHGIHVVLAGDAWELVGRRHGLGGLGDRLHRWFAHALGGGLHGERRGVLLGVVLGDDQGLSEGLRTDFRASGLYHLLAVSGQNVMLVAGGALILAWLLGIPRWVGQLGALASIGGYVLAVGPQPSVLRAGVAGALASLAWLTARSTDRWYFLLLGALALLAWNPYVVFDAGFQLSFAAVVAIFTLAPRVGAWLEGYPFPRPLREPVAISTACGVATAPILWFQFHAIPLVAVPANVAAAPIVVPLLGLAMAAAVVHPLAPGVAALIVQADGLCAAYLAGCAKVFARLPFAQIRSGWAVTALALLAAGAWAYAWRDGRPEARVPAHRHRSAEGGAGAAEAP